MSGDRRLRPRVAALAVVQAVLFGLGPAVDLPVVLTPATAVPVLLVALEAGPRVTAAFGAATVVLALVSGSIDGTFLEAQHVVRVTTVVGASVVALLAAAGRCRLEALVLENVRLMRDLAAAEAAQRDVAQSLQRSLRPPALPQIPGVALASFYRAVGDGADVGGDFYDAFPLTDGWLLVIGDVTGKGAAAASVTGMARGAIEAAALETGSAVGAVVRLDGLLARREDQALCSVACVHMHEGPEGMSADIVLAGHPPVLLRRGSEVEPLGTPGPLPGAFPGSSWTAQHVELRDGDVLVLRTDGATDAAGVDGRLGEERLRQTLRELEDVSAQHAVDRVRDVVLEHTDGPQRDDVAVLAVEVGAGARSVHMVLDGSAASVAKARRVVETHLSDELHAETLGRLRLLVSELATNAVKHGGDGSVRLTLGWDATVVRASIVDQGAGFALPIPRTRSARSLDDLAEGGYGLDLLAKMAQRWGVDDEGGTRVWFELDRR